VRPGSTGAPSALSLTGAAFSFDGHPLTYADAVLSAMVLGEWPDFVARCRLHRSDPETFEEDRASAWAEEFRRAHQLEAVADLDAWLALRHLDRQDFTRFGRWQAAGASPVASGGELFPDRGWWAEAVLSGDALRWVNALRDWLVAADLAPVVPAPDSRCVWKMAENTGPAGLTEAVGQERIAQLTALRVAHDGWLDGLLTDPVIEQRIVQHRLEWTRLVFYQCVLTSSPAAQEVAMCVNEEGEDAEQVATRSGCPLECHDQLRRDVPHRAAGVLSALRTGQASTPIAEEGTYTVYILVARVAPDSDALRMRKLARDEEVKDRLEVAGAGRFEDLGAW
jgi:hypothetical protein